MAAPEQWPRIKEIVGAALECPPGERISYLDGACSDDAQLRAEVDSLIAAYERENDFSSPGWRASLPEDDEEPENLGPYRLIRLLGVGGMGQVWLAEQTEPVRRFVAIKLVRANFYHPEIRSRFIAERQSLASMNHPYIAKVLEAGATPSGQPYFVMEYVDGRPITEYCDGKQLSIPERLRLLQLVCEGVQHAHLKAIVHRDLKPSNILIEEVDGKATPRIIDFGVAKTVSANLDPERTQTRLGSVIGTLGYMSPEQAAPGSEDIDTRTDGYSLGVILYELLTGTLPLNYRELSWYEVVRRLREQEPPRPSTRLRGVADAALVAHNRHMEVEDLQRALRGDLDSIVLKALEIDRNRRYETPSALGSDIEHFLEDEPVTARGASLGYRARKYLRRHRAGALVAVTAVFLLIGFVVMQAWQLRNTRRQRDRADRIADFMANMFKVPDPSESRGSTITARQVLDQSWHQVETGQGLDVAERQQLMLVMAKTYAGLGLYGRAHELAQQVYEARRRLLGPQNRQTLEAMTQQAEIGAQQGERNQAQATMREAIDQETQALGPEDGLTLKSKEDSAAMQESDAHYLEAEKLERQIIPVETRRLGPFHPQTFTSWNTLAEALKGQSRFTEAEKIFRQLLRDEQRTLGPDHPYLLVTMHNLANMLADQGRYGEAETLYRQTIAIESRVLGPQHPSTEDSITTLANTVTRDPQRKREAEALYRQSMEVEEAALGPDHPWTTRAREGLANNLGGQQRLAEAQSLLEQVLATRQRTLGPDNTDTLLTGYNVVCILVKGKHYPEAEQLMRNTFARQTQVLDANDPDTLASATMLAEILSKEGRPQEAETFARQAFTAQLRLLGPGHPDTIDSRKDLAVSLVQLGRYDEAEALYKPWIAEMVRDRKAGVSDAWDDFADVAALAGHANDAFLYLHNAVQAGFRDADNAKNDEGFVSLRKDPRFAQIVATMQRQSRNAQPAN